MLARWFSPFSPLPLNWYECSVISGITSRYNFLILYTELKTMHPISPNRVATSIVLAVGLVCWISCAMAQGTNDLPEKLATVNGKPIYQKDIVPDDTGIVRQLRVAVDHELIAQRAAKEGIDLPDRGPSRQALLGRLTQKETMWLGVMYEEKIWAGRTFDTPQNKAEAYGEWLRALLANVRVTVNGDAIPAAVIEQAMETVMTRLRRDMVEAGRGAALYDKISALVMVREAKERGVEPAVLATNAEGGQTAFGRGRIICRRAETAFG